MSARPAEGRHILVVEDEMTIAVLVEATLVQMGAHVIGPVARLDAALRLAADPQIEAAVLDINIRGGESYPVADLLAERAIPFVFCTGYSDWALQARYRERPRLTKPFRSADLEAKVLEMLNPTSR